MYNQNNQIIMSAKAQLQSKIENPLKKAEGIETKRNLRKFQADKTSYTSDNKQDIIIDISSPMELLDFQNGYLLFDIVATGTPTGGATGTLRGHSDRRRHERAEHPRHGAHQPGHVDR